MTNADRAKELTAQIPGVATEDEGTKEGLANNLMGVSPPSKPDSAKASDNFDIPTFRLHEYKRRPKDRSIAEGKLAEQRGSCAWSKSEGGVCKGVFFEIDHIDGDPTNDSWENLQLLCEHHHRIKSNSDRAKARHSASVCVKNAGVSFDGAGLSPRSVSLEDDKHENYTARFDRAAPAYFAALAWDSGESPIVSIRSFRRAMIGALAYTDEAGRKHRPSQVTIDRYIDAEIFPDNPDGRFAYAQTAADEDGIRWAAKRPESAKKEEKELET